MYDYSITMMLQITDDDDKDNYRLVCIFIIIVITIDVLIVSYILLTVTFIHRRMVQMLSIGPVGIRNGMWWRFFL